jgi:hypothetical protein
MTKFYINIPKETTNNSANLTVQNLDNYYTTNLPIPAGAFDALKGFFEGNGFGKVASETIAHIIFYQAEIDGYNPLQVIENIQTLNSVDLSALVTEILNFNRFKTSVLGLSVNYSTTADVAREIRP